MADDSNDLDLEGIGIKSPASVSTTGDAAKVPGVELKKIPTPSESPTTDERTRKEIAYRIIALMIGVVCVAFFLLIVIVIEEWSRMPKADAKDLAKEDAKLLMDLMNVIFGPVVTLVSSVVGFYFGAKTTRDATAAAAAGDAGRSSGG